jgi:hypothetical protein
MALKVAGVFDFWLRTVSRYAPVARLPGSVAVMDLSENVTTVRLLPERVTTGVVVPKPEPVMAS